ncbi:RNA helicase [Sarracenia purpurea var. burkii]
MKKEVSPVPESNVIKDYRMNEINEAFNMHGNSHHDQTERFTSYDDYVELDSSEADFSDDLGTDSDLGMGSDLEGIDDVDLLNQKNDTDNDLPQFFGKEGSLALLKAAACI